ncbi:MAG: ribonuclease domain-containing protein [Acidobacteriota bacterium]
MRKLPRQTTLVALVLLLALGYALSSWQATPASVPVAPTSSEPSTSARPPEPRPRPPADPAPAGPVAKAGDLVMRGQRVFDERGRLVYQGDIDLGPTVARIAAGGRDGHRNDGTVFSNRERRLPAQPRGYYTEWVIRTEGLSGVGPQRLITGRGGEAYYTPDHYETFVPLRRPS